VVDAELTGQLVLPNDLVMTPVAQLPPEVRRRFASKDGDVVLSRLGTRLRSCVIDGAGAGLLSFFQSPTRIVDAIVGYCGVHGLGTRETLVATYPMFRALVSDGLLIGAEQSTPKESAPLLTARQQFGLGTVVRCLRHLDDTEVYEVELPGGARRAVLKIGKNAGARALAREAQFLRTMGGEIAPRLLAELDVSGHPALLLEWCEGTSSALFAASLRLGSDPGAQRALLVLCQRIASAYAALHARCVLHGDVHPDNVRVAPDGTVRILDFGLARRIGERDHRALPRGAVWFFLAPERARRLLDAHRLQAPTARSEQYAVGALLYLLWTGEHYLEFRLDATEMLRQIRDRPRRSFAALGSVPRSSLEGALSRALSKDPRRRYPTLRALASAIAEDSHATATRAQPARVKEFVAATLRSCRLKGTFARGLSAPTASVYYGAAGVAFALLRIARARQRPDLLALSDGWCILAERELRLRRGTEIPAPDVPRESIGPVTPYHRGAGASLVRSAIAYSFGDDLGVANARRLFVRRSQLPSAIPDLTLGYAGVLAATASLLEASGRGDTALAGFGDALATRLRADVGKLGTPGQSPLVALGMAHGWAGVLYAQLRWLRVRAQTIDPLLLQSLHDLAELRLPSRRRYRWPVYAPGGSRRDTRDSLQGWCNGSAGVVLLWTEAAAATGDRTFWRLAEGAARDCLSDAAGSFNLCCGLTGRAYSLLVLARESRDPKWRDRARELGSLALRSRRAGIDGDASGYPHSLFRGDLGLAMLLVELDGPEDVGFPFVESL
jgi:serine/threonine-protein kinase